MDRYHHGDLPRALLDATVEVIAERGVDAASLREIARRAGVSHGAPAHHFGDKAGLLTALAAEGFERFRAALEQARDASTADARTRLNATGKAYLRFALDHPVHFEVMFRPALLHADDPHLSSHSAAAYEVLTGVIVDLKDTGVAPGVPTDLLATAAWGLVHGLATLWLEGNLRDRDLEADLDRMMAAMMTDG